MTSTVFLGKPFHPVGPGARIGPLSQVHRPQVNLGIGTTAAAHVFKTVEHAGAGILANRTCHDIFNGIAHKGGRAPCELPVQQASVVLFSQGHVWLFQLTLTIVVLSCLPNSCPKQSSL